MRFRTFVASTSLLFVLSSHSASAIPQEEREKISEFGRYEGYSEAIFEEWVNTSRYVAMRDGVRLAVDVTLPAWDGKAAEGRFPVVWTHSRYHRNPGGMRSGIRSMVDANPGLQRLVKHGYAVAAVGVRGSGASFGRFEGLFSAAETKDAAEIIAWLAAQPWCDGNVGMYGGSYLGITQYMAASENPPALKAIFPDVAAFDMYDLFYPGGVYRDDMIQHWDGLTRRLDGQVPAPRVDGDEGGELLAQAVIEHEDNWDVAENYGAARFRDHATELLDYSKHGPSTRLAAINEARIPAYHINGWFDVFALDATLWFVNYEGPQRLTMGAWSHTGMLMAERQSLTAVEQHRWFDRWLKGIENGIENEPPVHYAVMEDPGKWHWESSEVWPPPEAEPVTYWFAEGPSESVESVNDGLLSLTPPSEEGRFDAYTIDATTTTGTSTRWDNAVGAAAVMVYPKLAENDRKALTYTTAILEEPLTVVGHPVVTLFLSASQDDADIHVFLEEVDMEGNVRYVTEGVLRASHRKLGEAPYDNMGLPYQRSFEVDRSPLPQGEPTEMVMDLHPTANVFDAGHYLRIAITGADADNTESGATGDLGTIRIFRNTVHASRIVLPVVR